MAGIYGFENWKQQRGTPSPSEVGAMLLKKQQAKAQGPMGPAGAMAHGDVEQGEPTDPETGPGETVATETASTATADQPTEQMSQTAEWPSSAGAALRAAILRAAGNSRAPINPRNPGPENRSQLLRLGVPEDEVDLLNLTGGANAP